MQIEVLIGNEEPVVYPLKSAKVTLGTSVHCEITLNAEGISRKHISILTEGDNYYIIDLGSTNGSFINEERIVPGRKTEFTSFFPVRLGGNVLITLISDDEGNSRLKIPAPSNNTQDTQTAIIREKTLTNFTDPRRLKTGKIALKNGTRQKTLMSSKLKSKKQSSFVQIVAIGMVVVAGFFNFYVMEEPAEVQLTPLVKPREAPVQVMDTSTDKFLIPESEITKRDVYKDLTDEIKCTTEIEVNLCKFFPEASGGRFGVFQSGLTFHVIANGKKYFEKAQKNMGELPGNSFENLKLYNSLKDELAAYYYIQEIKDLYTGTTIASRQVNPQEPAAMPTPASGPKIDLDQLKGMRISIALMITKEDGSLEVGKVIALKPDVIPMLKDALKGDVTPMARVLNPNAFYEIKLKYRSY